MVGQDERIISIDTMGPHRLLRCLAQAGSGRLWEAERLSPDGGPVRCLVVVTEAADDPAFRERAAAINRLGPEGWASPRAVARDPSGRRQIVFEMNDALLLDEWAAGPRGTNDRLRLALALAEGLDRGHESGISHGRLSPSCVVVDDDGPRLIDLPLGESGKPDAVRDDRWAGPWERRDEGAVLGDRRRLAAGLYWLLAGRPARGEREHRAVLGALGLPDEVVRSVARGLDPAAEPASAAALARCIRTLLEPAPTESFEQSEPARLRLAGLAAAVLCVGALGYAAGQLGKARAVESYEQAAIAYESAAAEKDALIEELERRETLRRRAIGSVQDTLAYREYGAGITPNTLHVLGLIEMLTWPLDGSEESVNGRAKLHAERMKVARTLVDRAHEAADAEHIEVMLTELALGSWLFQSGDREASAVVLDRLKDRLAANLQASDPLRRGAEQLYMLASEPRLSNDEQFKSNLEPWVARVLANPIEPDSMGSRYLGQFNYAFNSLSEDELNVTQEDRDFTNRVLNQMASSRLLPPGAQ